MLGYNFYFGLVRKYVTLFGAVFDDISISREGNKTIKIPVEYGPKERYLTRQEQNPDLQRPISQVWPRMAFEIDSLEYDSTRKLDPNGFCTTGSSSSGTLKVQNNPAPWNINFRLSLISRNTEDALKVLEQILPFFSPTLNVTADLIPEMNYDPVTLPITLLNVNMNELYEGSFDDREYITVELIFELRGYMYGPISTSKVIKGVYIDLYTPNTNTAFQGVGTPANSEIVYVRPGLTANGTPTANAAASVPLNQISANSDYGFIVSITNG